MEHKVKIGVLCPASIAQNRFMPALMKNTFFQYVGIAHANAQERFSEHELPNADVLAKGLDKAQQFCKQFGGKIFHSYQEMMDAKEIDAVYIPLPPALHYEWAMKALTKGKHVFLEKPSTTSMEQTEKLVQLAKEKDLALCENYMFQYHAQLRQIKEMVDKDEIGAVRLIRIAFGFPFRGASDFRYNAQMGGGALLDCGGYTLRLADILLGETARIMDGALIRDDRFGVDLYGSAVLRSQAGVTAQLAFGMDNQYRCELEIWGSKGTLIADRIFTAPPDFTPTATLIQGNKRETISLHSDNQFYQSLHVFGECIIDQRRRQEQWSALVRQSQMVSELQTKMI